MNTGKNMNLYDLRSQWAIKGAEVKTIDLLDSRHGAVLDIINKDGEYTLQRFFPIGNDWFVSVDLDKVSADEVIDHLTDYMG